METRNNLDFAPRHLVLGVEGSNVGIAINLTLEPWFSEGVMMSDEACPYDDGSDAECAWQKGQAFERAGGFEAVIRALANDRTNRRFFTTKGEVKQEIIDAAKVLRTEFSGAQELLNQLCEW